MNCQVSIPLSREFCRVKYEDFDTVAAMIVENGVGSLISKTDIESAFNILPISPKITDF